MRRALAAGLLVVALGASACPRDDKGGDATTDSTTAGPSASSTSAHCTTDTKMDPYTAPPHTDSPSYAGPLRPLDNPKYTVNPPSGGDHLSRALGPGTYEGARVPLDGYVVHSLEHGYVIIWFKPGASDADREAIDSVRSQFSRDVLVVERSDMEPAVAATAWGHRLLCDGVDTDALAEFAKDFRNQAPEKIPH